MDTEDLRRSELEQANAKLRASLKQCHKMVAAYRSKLAANTNVPLVTKDEEEPGQVV